MSHRTWRWNPDKPITITLQVEGEWTLSGPDGSTQKAKGEYKLFFTAKSPTSLSMLVIDPDPGGGTP
ncbi:MAG TPA: hypothetical protein VGJ89_09250 [Geothrix sp.]